MSGTRSFRVGGANFAPLVISEGSLAFSCLTPTDGVQIASTPHDLGLIGRLRYDVYVDEMQKKYPEANHEQRSLSDQFDPVSANLFVPHDHRAIAAVRLTLASDCMHLGLDDMCCPRELIDAVAPHHLSITSRLVVCRDRRGTLASLDNLLRAVYTMGAIRGDRFNFIHARRALGRFFEHIGFRRFGASFTFGQSGVEHDRFIMIVDDIPHFDLVKSPLAPIARRLFADGPRKESLELVAGWRDKGVLHT